MSAHASAVLLFFTTPDRHIFYLVRNAFSCFILATKLFLITEEFNKQHFWKFIACRYAYNEVQCARKAENVKNTTWELVLLNDTE